jgi:DNA-binding transcriptional LysR family regulator
MTQYPKANVRLEYLHPHRVIEAIENDQADIGLISYPKPSRTIKAITWREEPMRLVCSPNNTQFANLKTVALEQLNNCSMIGFDADLTIRRDIDRALANHNSEARIVMEFDNIETIKRALEINAGVAILPEPTVTREVAAGSLVAIPITGEELVRPIGILYRRGKDLGVTVKRFIELLRNGEGAIRNDHAQHDETQSTAKSNGKVALVSDSLAAVG